MPKQPTEPPRSVRLPREEEQALAEEASASNRSATGIITEALRLRRSVLEALGVQAAGTEPSALATLVQKLIRMGMKAQQQAKKQE